MSSSSAHSLSAPTADLFIGKTICDEFPDIFELPLGLLPNCDTEHKTKISVFGSNSNLLDLNILSRIIINTY